MGVFVIVIVTVFVGIHELKTKPYYYPGIHHSLLQFINIIFSLHSCILLKVIFKRYLAAWTQYYKTLT